jgi:hypothetical protein
MTDEQFAKLLEAMDQQKRIIAYIGLFVTYQFWTMVALLAVVLLALLGILIS